VTVSCPAIGQLLLRCLNSGIHALAMPSPWPGFEVEKLTTSHSGDVFAGSNFSRGGIETGSP
jgi:hypothetical protein